MCVYDVFDDQQAESGTAFVRGEARVENLGTFLGWDSRAIETAFRTRFASTLYWDVPLSFWR